MVFIGDDNVSDKTIRTSVYLFNSSYDPSSTKLTCLLLKLNQVASLEMLVTFEPFGLPNKPRYNGFLPKFKPGLI